MGVLADFSATSAALAHLMTASGKDATNSSTAAVTISWTWIFVPGGRLLARLITMGLPMAPRPTNPRLSDEDIPTAVLRETGSIWPKVTHPNYVREFKVTLHGQNVGDANLRLTVSRQKRLHSFYPNLIGTMATHTSTKTRMDQQHRK